MSVKSYTWALRYDLNVKYITLIKYEIINGWK
jgi:hypothetical protein